MRLPTINDIEAFVVAARHLNFTKAGNELNLTSSAISQRVAALEQQLGMQLFGRNGPRLALTDKGKVCLPILRETLAQFRESIGSLQTLTQNQVLTLRVSPSFADKWLNPRLASFEKQYPDIDLRIWGMATWLRSVEESPCLSVSYGIDPGDGVPADHEVEKLFEEEVFPVCSPDYLDRVGPVETLDDLRKMRLLHDDTMSPMRSFPDWQRWCARFGVNQVDTSRGPRFNLSSILLDAAIAGRGVALGRSLLAQDYLASGELVRLFEEVFPLTFEYFLVYPSALLEHPDFEPCHSWLFSEAAKVPPVTI